ncbi:MAG: hypothetical protein VKL02_14800 [Cylindrospermopsis raciborskii 1523720]|nr:hypothetical protein [Cylindrospermopsis raciborskii]
MGSDRSLPIIEVYLRAIACDFYILLNKTTDIFKNQHQTKNKC